MRDRADRKYWCIETLAFVANRKQRHHSHHVVFRFADSFERRQAFGVYTNPADFHSRCFIRVLFGLVRRENCGFKR